MKFVNPWMLALVLFVPLAGAWWLFLRARAEKRLSAFVAPALMGRLVPKNPRLFNVQALLLMAGLALVAFAASRPQWGHSAQVVKARTRNVVVALDVSRSMLAADVRPNRLERAKADIADLIDSLEGDRCALVAFRRTGILLCPLTTDHAFLRSALESATPESAPRGETDLGSAIRASLDALDPAADDHNAVILISDGGDLRGGALAAARDAAKRNVPVFTVGLGDPRSETSVPDAAGTGVQQYKGAAVKTKLEDATLAAIAKASGGRYVPLATAGTAETTLGAIYRRFLRQVAAKEQAEEEEMRATERFGIFLVPGLLLVLLAAFLSRGRFAGRNGHLRKAAALAAVVCLGFAAHAQTPAPQQAPASASVPESESASQSAVAPEQASAPEALAAAIAAESSLGNLQGDVSRAPLTDGEIWNNGLDFYNAGDFTNALAVLRPLMLSRTHGARAAEVVGAIQHDRMKAASAEDAASAAAAAEDAAAAMQIALRASPEDPRANRNFTRAIDPLPELRERAHVEAVLKSAQGQDPGGLLGGAVQEARRIMREGEGVLTNAPARAIARSEALGRAMEKLSDVWIPVKQGVMQSVTNEQQAARIVGDVESSRDAAKKTADLFADMDPSAASAAAGVETALTRFWKMTVMPPAALDEDILSQTNAYIALEPFNGRPWQAEALDFTRAFRARFPQWAQAYEQQAQADTNKPPFTKEAQAQISALATEVEKLQIELQEKELPPKMLEALEKLQRIKELMPKDNSKGGQSQDNQQQSQSDQQQDKKDQDKNDQQQDQQNDQDQQQDQPQEQQEQNAETKPDEQKTDREVEALLQKAQERSDNHENEKKARMRKAPLSPNERDW
jgi:Ca-activated chloride channel family protein